MFFMANVSTSEPTVLAPAGPEKSIGMIRPIRPGPMTRR